LVLESEVFILAEVLEPVCKHTQNKSQQKGLLFTIEKETDLPVRLEGDAKKLKVIFEHLLDNAVKFTEQGGITVQLKNKDLNNVQILNCTVSDSGIGMDEDQLSNLFQSFTQGDGSSTRKYGGLGLGMTLCKRMVTELGGELTVESEPGHGSTFNFTAKFSRVAGSDAHVADPVENKERAEESETVEINLDKIDFKALDHQLKKLAGLIEKHDMEAVTLFTKIQNTLTAVDAVHTKKLMLKLDSFDFKGAMQNVSALQTSLEDMGKDGENYG